MYCVQQGGIFVHRKCCVDDRCFDFEEFLCYEAEWIWTSDECCKPELVGCVDNLTENQCIGAWGIYRAATTCTSVQCTADTLTNTKADRAKDRTKMAFVE